MSIGSIRLAAATAALTLLAAHPAYSQKTVGLSAVYSAGDPSHPSGRLEVFVARAGSGSKAGIFHTWETVEGPWQQPWMQYSPAPDDLRRGIVAGRDGAGRVVVSWIANGSIFVLSAFFPGASLHTPAYQFDPTRLPTLPKFRSLTLANNANGLVELLALDVDGRLWSVKQLANTNSANPEYWSWRRPTLIGGTKLKNISVTRYGDGRLAAVATGGDGIAYFTTQDGPNGAWAGSWTSLGGHDLETVEAQESLDHRLEVVAVGGDRRLYLRYEPFSDNSWVLLRAGRMEPPIFFGREADGTLLLVFHDYYGKLGNLRQTSPNGDWPTRGQLLTLFGDRPESDLEAMTSDLGNRHGLVAVLKGDEKRLLAHLQQGPNEIPWYEGGALPDLP